MIIVLLDRVDDGRDMRGSAGRIIHPDCAQLSGNLLKQPDGGRKLLLQKSPGEGSEAGNWACPP